MSSRLAHKAINAKIDRETCLWQRNAVDLALLRRSPLPNEGQSGSRVSGWRKQGERMPACHDLHRHASTNFRTSNRATLLHPPRRLRRRGCAIPWRRIPAFPRQSDRNVLEKNGQQLGNWTSDELGLSREFVTVSNRPAEALSLSLSCAQTLFLFRGVQKGAFSLFLPRWPPPSSAWQE